MIYLLLSILCSTLIILIFKAFERFEVNTFHAIVVNYITCVIVGLPFTDMTIIAENPMDEPWFLLSVILGVLFISIFYLVGLTAQKVGITVASVSMKLSLAVPLTLAFFIYNETFSWIKLFGIILALAAVVLTSIKRQKHQKEETTSTVNPIWLLLLPLGVFAGSGMTDSIVQYTEITFFDEGGFEGFVLFLFGTAALIGLIISLFRTLISKKGIIPRSVIGGIALGVPNYGSIYFFYATLVETGWETSVVFPVNNIAIVSAAAISARVIFAEKLQGINYLGLLCAIVSIILIGMAEYNA